MSERSISEIEGPAGEIPENIRAAIEIINRGAGHIDRNDPRAILDHNKSILAAREELDRWISSAPSLVEVESRRGLVDSIIGTQSISPGGHLERTLGTTGRSGEGHTRSIPLTVSGTGLKGQEKPPKYNKKGELA